MRVTSVFAVIFSFVTCVSPANAAEPPDVFFMDGQRLLDARQRIAAGDPELAAAVPHLIRFADRALNDTAARGPFSVVDDDLIPISGDKHDFQSISQFACPDPNTEDGLPWIRCTEGTSNARFDLRQLDKTFFDVIPLSQAYYLTGQELYADAASSLLRTFFLDEATRMNPNAAYSKVWPGVNDTGFATSLVGGRLIYFVDAVTLLRDSRHWSDSDELGIREWTGQYLDWMQSSDDAAREFASRGDHGTITELQMATFAEFSGNTLLAKEILSNAFETRIAPQISADGFQPILPQTLNYYELNSRWLTHYPQLAERYDIDIWNAETEDGRGIRLALESLIPYATGEVAWPFPGGAPPERLASRFYRLFRVAALAYDDPLFDEAARNLYFGAPSNSGYERPQWTDLLWSLEDPIFGDVNGDGTVDNFDHYPLILAVEDPAAFAEQFPDVPRAAADFDANDKIDSRDLETYLALDLPFGDTNRDGVVDIMDLINVRNNFGSSDPLLLGDTNGDGLVNIDDLNHVRNHFGYRASPVPEPAGVLLLISGGVSFLLARKRALIRTH